MYVALKHIHLMTIALSAGLFLTQYILMVTNSNLQQKKIYQDSATRSKQLATAIGNFTTVRYGLGAIYTGLRVANREVHMFAGLYRFGCIRSAYGQEPITERLCLLGRTWLVGHGG